MHPTRRSLLAPTLALASFLAPTALLGARAAAQEGEAHEEEVLSYDDVHAFDREFAIAGYATGHAGSYLAGGLGGRLRWEPLELLGIEAYVEATIVEWAGGGVRHDYPNGFNVYIPIRVDDVRVRPFLGFCDIVSLVEPEQPGAPRADDVLFGAHAGVGAELALHPMASMFVDLSFNAYAGHDRTVSGWTGGVDETLVPFWNVQLNVGAQFHLGRR